MNTHDLEFRLKQAATIAAPPRSIAEEVLRQLPTAPHHPLRSRWKHPALAAALATLTGIAAILAIAFLLAGNTVRLTLADVQSAVNNQHWAHVHYDAGAVADEWTNLQTGESYSVHNDGTVDYINKQTNQRLYYWKPSETIQEHAFIKYPAGSAPPKWTPGSAWEQLVEPNYHFAVAIKPATTFPSSEGVPDALNGVQVVRFDYDGMDDLGKFFVITQLWADPRTRLPVRIKRRLQFAEREQYHQEWTTGDYTFPTTGPADIYTLGVPRDTPIEKEVTTAPADVQPILDAINHAHDNFLKNYRATVISYAPDFQPDHPWKRRRSPIDTIDVIWRDGETVRYDHHLPGIELQDHPDPPLPVEAAPENLLPWTTRHEPLQKDLFIPDRQYSWIAKTPQPQVQVIRKGGLPPHDADCWPEGIQWPSRYYAPDFQLLPVNSETPPNCIGLRLGGAGNSRSDFYVDPQNDYICIKNTAWTKRAGTWTKETEITISDFHRIAGRTIPAMQIWHSFGDPAKHFYPATTVRTIDIHPLSSADYPTGVFDPAVFTAGATIEGY